MKHLDQKKRQDDILELIIREYTENAHTVSSEGLRKKYNLPMSSATLRNVMAELEGAGYISHIHTSSGRVPTPEGFRYYVDMLMSDQEDLVVDYEYIYTLIKKALNYQYQIENMLEEISRVVSSITHYMGLGMCSGRERVFFSGTHFIFEQPDFEDIVVLKNLFQALEEKYTDLWSFVNKGMDKDVKVFIGKDIDILRSRDFSLALSSFDMNKMNERIVFGVVGPVRMDYSSVVKKLKRVKEYLEDNF